MFRILLELCPFSSFLKSFDICALFVCSYRKSVFVLDGNLIRNNRNGSSLIKTEVYIPRFSLSYCEFESQPSVKNPIQNP